MKLPFLDKKFDIVICAHVYEHVPDAKKLLEEIFRVLKPGGVCYFAAGNRLMWNEPHYNLPLLSVLPRPLAHLYIRLAGKANYYHEKHLSYWGLRSLVKDYNCQDYTVRIVKDPAKFHIDYMLVPGSLKAKIARIILSNFYWLSPGYIWLLSKPEQVDSNG
jgi:SAM-dependent methyltransferase